MSDFNSNGNVESSNNNNNNEEWTESEINLFEDALGELEYKNRSEMFVKIMEIMPWKSLDQIKTHYAKLISDVMMNEKDDEIVPTYFCGDRVAEVQPRIRKGSKWTIPEHRAFLRGLDIFGKGEWKAIAEMFVPTKTTSQVASHGQRYFRRKTNDTPLNKRRLSIHDIRIVNSTIVETFPRKPGTHHCTVGRRRIGTTTASKVNNKRRQQQQDDAVVGLGQPPALIAAVADVASAAAQQQIPAPVVADVASAAAQQLIPAPIVAAAAAANVVSADQQQIPAPVVAAAAFADVASVAAQQQQIPAAAADFASAAQQHIPAPAAVDVVSAAQQQIPIPAPAAADVASAPNQLQLLDVLIDNWGDFYNIDFDALLADMPDIDDIFSGPFN